MSEVFISYKREDEVRVVRLVRGLEGVGYSVWWDRGLAGGESWRVQIQTALHAAKCVIVVWTQESVGPSGDFVRDEASQAKRRGVLVPVSLDKVDPPLGFGELQTIDLAHWKGKLSDPFFQDLCASVTAKLEGLPVPPAKGPMKRLGRRVTWGGLGAVGFSSLMFGFNLFSAQDQVCGISFLQPEISDACGSLGLGNRPTRKERIAWQGREQGSCEALRAHIKDFPEGTYRNAAADLLAGRRVTQREAWTSATRRLVLHMGDDGTPSDNEVRAQFEALLRAQNPAERLCKGFAATTSFRFISAKPAAQHWNCSAVFGGVACGFEGEAVCEVDERNIQETETCG